MRLVRSRIVMPVSAPSIRNGAVVVRGGEIMWVGSWPDARRQFPTAAVEDLGEVILLPGLVNAHCHLEYTGMGGRIPPQKSFKDWILSMLSLKAAWDSAEFAASWMAGAGMLLVGGTTTVADVVSVPGVLDDVLHTTPLRVVPFLEMTGVRGRANPGALLQEALRVVEQLKPHHAAGLSPHSPYATLPALLRQSAHAARERELPVTMHVAESREEFDMFRYAEGPLYEWLKGQREMSDCGSATPVAHVHASGLLSRQLLAVHANYLEDNDFVQLRRSRTNIVHCPRSHRYFGHGPFPYWQLREAGVNVCLGTDSLASVRTDLRLDMFLEMESFARAHPEVEPEEILAMATSRGAVALGREGRQGVLGPGALADWVALSFGGAEEEAADAVVHGADVGKRVMLGGEWLERGSWKG